MFVLKHFGMKKTAAAKIENLYNGMIHKLQYTFTKEGVSVDDLKKRFEDLSNPQQANRSELIKMFLQTESRAEREAVGTLQELKTQDSLSNKSAEDSFSSKDATIEVRVVGDRPEPQIVMAKRKPLLDQSDFFRTRTASIDLPNSPAVVELDVNDTNLKAVKPFQVLSSNILERVFKVCENPQIVEKAQVLEDELRELKERIDNKYDDNLKGLHRRREEWVAKAKLKLVDEKESLVKENEIEFQEYISNIKNAFDRRLEKALALRERQYQKHLDDIQLFFSTEEELLRSWTQRVKIIEGERANNELTAYKNLIAEIFDKDVTLKLALAASLFQISALEDACKSLVSKNFMDYIDCKEWSSDLIKEKYHRELLPALSTWEILELQRLEPPQSWLHKDFLKSEIAQRRKIIRQELEEMNNRELHAITESNHPFPDLVEAAVSKRNSSRGMGALNASLKCAHIRLSNSNSTVSVIHPQRFAPVQGIVHVVCGSWGRPYYEVTIDHLDAAFGSTCAVGWDLKRESLANFPIAGLTCGEDGVSYGVSIQNDGFVNARGKAEFVGFSFHQNSVVGCGLDLANSRAVFVVNGKTIDLSAAQEEDMRLQANCAFVPAATIFAARLNSQCQVTFNFTGPFKFEQFFKDGRWSALADSKSKDV
uniref:B30.2/SPRY domain-containing protein n=1 Tax=Guillardia theta TaxID=55529 RepID=A0A7S4KY52_GUITH